MDKTCKSLSSNTYIKPKDRKRSLSGKKRPERVVALQKQPQRESSCCGCFLNNRNALWYVKICHDAKIVLWLLKEMTTTSSDFMKISQGVVVLTFHSHDAM